MGNCSTHQLDILASASCRVPLMTLVWLGAQRGMQHVVLEEGGISVSAAMP